MRSFSESGRGALSRAAGPTAAGAAAAPQTPGGRDRPQAPARGRWLGSLCGLALVLAGGEARADIVVFKTGRTMSVAACRIAGDGLATLALGGGGEIVFPANLIDRVVPDEVPDPAPIDGGAPAAAAGGSALTLETSGQAPALAASRPFGHLIAAVAAREGVDARLVHAIVEVESAYQPRARSPKGARGLMQLMPATAQHYAVRDPYDPEANLEAGVRHLKSLLSRFDLAQALAAYNAGEEVVRRYGGLPPFPETRRYVQSVLERVAR